MILALSTVLLLTKYDNNQCAPPENIKIRQTPGSKPTSIPSSKISSAPTYAPVRMSSLLATSLPPPTTCPAATSSFPRFGSSAACPGCNKSVSAMERGVVPGPQGTRWHSICLVCGGKDATNRKGRREDDKQPGCGKKLDSAAKGDGEGGVWCRECLVGLALIHREYRHTTNCRF